MARADLGRLCPVRWPTPQRRTISPESGVRAPLSMLARDAGLAAMDSGATASAAPRSTSSGEIRLPLDVDSSPDGDVAAPSPSKGGQSCRGNGPVGDFAVGRPLPPPADPRPGARRAAPYGRPRGMASRVDGGARCLAPEVGLGGEHDQRNARPSGLPSVAAPRSRHDVAEGGTIA